MNIPIKFNNAQTTIDGSRPVVILGANGSGKTRYGLQMADWNNAEIIAALRNIALEENIPLQSLAQAEQELQNQKRRRKQRPWSISSEINNLFAKLMAEDSASATRFRDTYQKNGGDPEITKLMRLQKSWQELFPGRRISFGGYTPKVTSEYVNDSTGYPAQSMSDGERVALYLAGRVLETTSAIIIIDEPEVHFHSRLAIQFWDELEQLRPDCRFVYITHDLTFARSRVTNDYLIVRPKKEPELVNVGEGIPADIIEDILSAASFSIFANRIIFCEGTESSYDQKFFRAWFRGRKDAVVPVGSCKDVIKCTSAFQESNVLEGVSAIGIIDRDYLPEVFFTSIPSGVSVLPAHEIESLFCMEDLFRAVAIYLGHSDEEAKRLYEEFCVDAASRFRDGLLMKQISERFRSRCVEQVHRSINALRVDGVESDVRANHCAALAPENWNIAPETIFDEEKSVVVSGLTAPYENMIKLLPGKVYLGILVQKIGMDKEAYVDLIVGSLKTSDEDALYALGRQIRAALSGILPNS